MVLCSHVCNHVMTFGRRHRELETSCLHHRLTNNIFNLPTSCPPGVVLLAKAPQTEPLQTVNLTPWTIRNTTVVLSASHPLRGHPSSRRVSSYSFSQSTLRRLYSAQSSPSSRRLHETRPTPLPLNLILSTSRRRTLPQRKTSSTSISSKRAGHGPPALFSSSSSRTPLLGLQCGPL